MATILVVDDRPLNRQFLNTLLGYAGHRVIEAGDGEEALERLRSERPALIISDILMPRLDGLEFVRRLHDDAALRDIPVIFYTATYRLGDARDLATECGVRHVIAKPSEPQVILDTVQSVLGPPSAPRGPQEAPAGKVSVAGRVSNAMGELTELQLRMRKTVERGLSLVEGQGGLQDTATGLIHSFTVVQALSMRLSALVELSLEMETQHEPQGLIELCCRAAQDILNARYAAIGLVNGGDRLVRHAARGLSDNACAEFASLAPRRGVFGAALAAGRLCRVRETDTAPENIGLVPSHPPVRELLIVPLRSATHTYGWLYLADKLSDEWFGEDDEEFALTLAAQVALAYENLLLVDAIGRHANELESEVAERRLAEAAARESESRFRQLAESIREVYFLVNAEQTEVLYVSPAYDEVWGQSREELRTRPLAWMDAVHPYDLPRVRARHERSQASGAFDDEYRIVRPDGSIRWVWARGFPILDAAGRLYRVAGVVEDITKRKMQEERITKLTRIQRVMSGINSAIVRIHERRALSNEACRIAVDRGQFGMAWIGMIDPASETMTPLACAGMCTTQMGRIISVQRDGVLEGGGPVEQALRNRRTVYCNDITHNNQLCMSCIPLRDDALQQGYCSMIALPLVVSERSVGVMVLYAAEIGYFNNDEVRMLNELAGDISFGLQYIEKEERLSYLAYYDALTGLPNSALFHDRLSQLMLRSSGEHDNVAVIVFDLDRFSRYNDTLGRHVGDGLLQHVALCLKRAVHEPCSLARISADTFAVAVAGLYRGTDAGKVLEEQIFASLNLPMLVEDREIRLTAHAGIALYPNDGRDATTLFKNAEAALMSARASSESFLYYAPEINATVAARLMLEASLRTAIENREFVMHYQPRVDLRTGLIVGAEALIRWQRPGRGLVPPGVFIPLAEETGLIFTLGEWVIEAVCAQQAVWLAEDKPVIPVALNVSAKQFRKGSLPQVLRQTLSNNGLDARYVELELTESMVMQDPEGAALILRLLRDQGLRLALDDFGTGYSSLAYLKRFPFDAVKIDRTFVTDITQNTEDAAIANAVIAMAHQLKLRVVAEGVETAEQLEYLRRHGCDEMQGYHFSPPVPAGEFMRLLQEGRRIEMSSDEDGAPAASASRMHR